MGYGFIMHQSCLPMTRKPRASASGLRVIGKQRGCIIIRVSHECPFDNLFIHRSLHNLKKTGGLFCPGHSYDVETGFLECGEVILWAKNKTKEFRVAAAYSYLELTFFKLKSTAESTELFFSSFWQKRFSRRRETSMPCFEKMTSLFELGHSLGGITFVVQVSGD